MCWSVLDIFVNVRQAKLKYRICQISLDILNKWQVSLFAVFYLKKHQLNFLMGLQHMCKFWCGTEKIKLERGESPFCVSVEVALEDTVELLLSFWKIFCSQFILSHVVQKLDIADLVLLGDAVSATSNILHADFYKSNQLASLDIPTIEC